MLTVDEFIEHGEVQEGREVHGRNMMFKSDVFGRVLSDGENIQLKKQLFQADRLRRFPAISILPGESHVQWCAVLMAR